MEVSSVTETRPSGLVVPSGSVPEDVPVEASARSAAAYWRARYDALEARVAEPDIIANSAQFVLAAAVTANSTGLPFRQTFDNMLARYLKEARMRRTRNNTQTRTPKSKRK